MAKRFATQVDLDNAPILPVMMPRSSHRSDPISHGKRPEIYTADGLKMIAVKKHARTHEFE